MRPDEKLSEPVAFCVFHLAAEKRRRELVGFVADDQVVATIRRAEFLLHVFVARKFVEPRNGEVVFEEPIPRSCGFEFVVCEDFERHMKTPVQLVLPLLD